LYARYFITGAVGDIDERIDFEGKRSKVKDSTE